MDGPDRILSPVKGTWIQKTQALFEVVLLSSLVSSFFAAIPFSAFGKASSALLKDARLVMGFVLLESAITFFLLALLLRAHEERLGDLGLRWKEWKPNVILGLILVPVLFLINTLVSIFFRVYLPKYFIQQNPLTEIIRTPSALALFIVSALIAGGIKEEFQRAFILTRFEEHLGGARLGLLIWSLAFGAEHYVQGAQGVTIAALFGFIFGAVYLIQGNILGPMVAHGLYDTLALLAYWFTRDLPK